MTQATDFSEQNRPYMSELLKHSIIFACATFISRILGLVRDGFFAHYFGTAPEYSVYLLAIGLPFYLRQMFAEGALSSAFIPLFTRKEGKEKQVFLSTAFWLLLIVTIILYDIVLIFSGQISFVLGSGLTPEMRDLMSFLLKITFPFITFISLWAIISGVLNTYNMFFVTAISPALSNIVIILAVVMSGFFIPKILGPTIGFVLGGVLQLVFVLFFLRRTNMRITLDYNRTYTKEILNLFGPAFLGASVSMLNTVIDTSIATWTGDSGVSIISYALRIYQLPLSLFSVSVANSLLPKLSKAVIEKDKTSYSKNLRDSVNIILFFTVPSCIALLFLNRDIISLIFEHGSFSSQDSIAVGAVLAAYAIGLPFYSLHTIFIRTYHSKLNTKYPMYVAVVLLAVNAVLDMLFAKSLGPVGIALATSFSGIVGCVLTGFKSLKYFSLKDFTEMGKIVLASICMMSTMILDLFISDSFFLKLIKIILSCIIFFAVAYFLKVRQLNSAITLINSKFRQKHSSSK